MSFFRGSNFLLWLVVPLGWLPVIARSQSSLPAEPDPRQVQALISLIEGPNSPEARRTGARELLRLDPPGGRERLITALESGAPPVQAAVASALADLPQYLRSDCIEPLLKMLIGPDAEARQAAALALASYRDATVVPDLASIALDPQRDIPSRLAAIDALGMMTRREAAGVLVLALEDEMVQAAALTALEQATALRFEEGAVSARAWWDRTRNIAVEDWQRLQLDRLTWQFRESERERALLEGRLAKVMRDAYLLKPEADRATMLLSMLSDASPAIQLLALELMQAAAAEGRLPSADAVARVRELMVTATTRVRAAAVRTLSVLRDTADAEPMLARLTAEHSPQVLTALINALGHIGGPTAGPRLLEILHGANEACRNEAITALGRLAERGALLPESRAALVNDLMELERNARSDAALRERVVPAMARVADPAFGPLLLAALEPENPAGVRQSAVRGIEALARSAAENGTNHHAESESFRRALGIAADDPDVGLRKAAVAALAAIGPTEEQAPSLWRRATDPSGEPDAAVRQGAWHAVLRWLSGQPASVVLDWAEKLPDRADTASQLAELLGLADRAGGAASVPRPRFGVLRARVALAQHAAGDLQAAAGTYRQSIEELGAEAGPNGGHLAGQSLLVALSVEPVHAALLGAIGTHLADHTDEAWRFVLDTAVRQAGDGEAAQAERLLNALETLKNPPWHPDPAALGEARRQLKLRSSESAARQSISALAANPQDLAAQRSIVNAGPQAAPLVREALLGTVQTASGSTYEAVLVEMLKKLEPDWSGYPPNASLDDKLRALDAAQR